MSVLTGSFNKSGSPVLKILVFGAYKENQREFDAIIDTGFTGFLSMPFVAAFPIGLPLIGTSSVNLADGSSASVLLTSSVISVGGQEHSGICLLSPDSKEIRFVSKKCEGT